MLFRVGFDMICLEFGIDKTRIYKRGEPLNIYSTLAWQQNRNRVVVWLSLPANPILNLLLVDPLDMQITFKSTGIGHTHTFDDDTICITMSPTICFFMFVKYILNMFCKSRNRALSATNLCAFIIWMVFYHFTLAQYCT